MTHTVGSWMWRAAAAAGTILAAAAALAADDRPGPPGYLLPGRAADTDAGWFSRLSFSAEGGGYIFGDTSHAWHHRLAATITVRRFSNGGRLLYYGDAALVANADNPIHFSPLGIFYDNLILFHQPRAWGGWSAGYFQRCKHQVDESGRVWLYNGPYLDLNFRRTWGRWEGDLTFYSQPALVYVEDPADSGNVRSISGFRFSACWSNRAFLTIAPGMALTRDSSAPPFSLFSPPAGPWVDRIQPRILLGAGYQWEIKRNCVQIHAEYCHMNDAGIANPIQHSDLFMISIIFITI